LAVTHTDDTQFDQEDVRIMQALANLVMIFWRVK